VTKRIYVIEPLRGSHASPTRLIEAGSKQQALAFAAKTSLTVRLATQHDIVELLEDCGLEHADGPQQTDLEELIDEQNSLTAQQKQAIKDGAYL
jgi:hypothetical protein